MILGTKFISWERIFCLQQGFRVIRVRTTFITFLCSWNEVDQLADDQQGNLSLRKVF